MSTSDSEASPIPSPEPKSLKEGRISPRDPYDMDSSNASSCSSAGGRRSPAPVDEDSRSSERRPASGSDAGHKQPGFLKSAPTAAPKSEVGSCNGEQVADKSESESSDIDIEDEMKEVRVKQETKSPAKKTLPAGPAKPLRSFLIDDILNHKPKRSHSSTTTTATTTMTTTTSRCANTGAAIVRPWDLPSNNRTTGSSSNKRPYSHHHQRASSPPHSRSLPGYERTHSLYVRNRTSSSPKVSGIRPRSADDDSQSEASSDMSEETTTGRDGNSGKGHDGNSPLDALFELTNKALDRVNGDKSGGEYLVMLSS